MLSVSIAMATYNGEKYIEQQLKSLADQTYRPKELVVTDDVSKDSTLSIIRDFAKSSPFPIQLHINEKRLGYRANFMHAANLCASDLIAFCDQDDQWYPNKIAVCVAQFTERDVLLVHHQADVVLEGGQLAGRLNKTNTNSRISPPLSLDPFSFASGFTQMFRKSLLPLSEFWPMSLDHAFENERMAHDQWFFFLASVLGEVSYLNDPLAAYLQHGRNTFGYIEPPRHFRKIAVDLQNPAQQLFRSAAAAEARASILEALKSHLNGEQRHRAEMGTAGYRKLSRLSSLRATIYSSSSLSKRLSAFGELVKTSGYGSNWKLSYRSLLKDLCVGIPIGSK